MNDHLNQFLEHLRSSGSCIFTPGGEIGLAGHICTGNAGEHAMTMSLALKLRVASGFAVEPFQYLDIFERLNDEQIKILQVRTVKPPPPPYFHTDRGGSHISKMLAQGLSAIYHNPLAGKFPDFKKSLRGDISGAAEPKRCRIYPPAEDFDLGPLRAMLLDHKDYFSVSLEVKGAQNGAALKQCI